MDGPSQEAIRLAVVRSRIGKIAAGALKARDIMAGVAPSRPFDSFHRGNRKSEFRRRIGFAGRERRSRESLLAAHPRALHIAETRANVKGDQVGTLAGRDAANFVVQAEMPGGMKREHVRGRRGRHAGFHHANGAS
jgi:hypothetical protein